MPNIGKRSRQHWQAKPNGLGQPTKMLSFLLKQDAKRADEHKPTAQASQRAKLERSRARLPAATLAVSASPQAKELQRQQRQGAAATQPRHDRTHVQSKHVGPTAEQKHQGSARRPSEQLRLEDEKSSTAGSTPAKARKTGDGSPSDHPLGRSHQRSPAYLSSTARSWSERSADHGSNPPCPVKRRKRQAQT